MGKTQRPPKSVREFIEDRAALERWLSVQAKAMTKCGATLSYGTKANQLELLVTVDGRIGCMRVYADGRTSMRIDQAEGGESVTSSVFDEFDLVRGFAQFRRAVVGGVLPMLKK